MYVRFCLSCFTTIPYTIAHDDDYYYYENPSYLKIVWVPRCIYIWWMVCDYSFSRSQIILNISKKVAKKAWVLFNIFCHISLSPRPLAFISFHSLSSFWLLFPFAVLLRAIFCWCCCCILHLLLYTVVLSFRWMFCALHQNLVYKITHSFTSRVQMRPIVALKEKEAHRICSCSQTQKQHQQNSGGKLFNTRYSSL